MLLVGGLGIYLFPANFLFRKSFMFRFGGGGMVRGFLSWIFVGNEGGAKDLLSDFYIVWLDGDT